MCMPEVSRTKAGALAALEEEYRKTLLTVQDYADEEFEVPRSEGVMSPKDTFAHLAWWNWEAPSGLQRIKRDEMPFWVHMDLDELRIVPERARSHFAGHMPHREWHRNSDWPVTGVWEGPLCSPCPAPGSPRVTSTSKSWLFGARDRESHQFNVLRPHRIPWLRSG